MPELGDYVLATKYDDGDPQDHWAIGYFDGITSPHYNPPRYNVVNSDGEQFRGNGFRRVEKIDPVIGAWLLEHAEQIQQSGKSVWDWAIASTATPDPSPSEAP